MKKARIFRCSSAVEQSTVNRLVAGSNPAAGANKKNPHKGFFFVCRGGETVWETVTSGFKEVAYDFEVWKIVTRSTVLVSKAFLNCTQKIKENKLSFTYSFVQVIKESSVTGANEKAIFDISNKQVAE